MTRFAEVIHALDIVAPIDKVRSQFADLDHHISTNVHPKLSFQVLEKRADGARFVQVVKLLGIKQRDVFERTVAADGTFMTRVATVSTRAAAWTFSSRLRERRPVCRSRSACRCRR